MQRTAVIVDPYLSAAEFAAEFAARGVTPVAVFSSPEPLTSMDWQPEQADGFAALHFLDGDLGLLVETVRNYDPMCVIAGNEAGVELADHLSGAVTPAGGNEPGMVAAQRDKWRQGLALMKAGVPHLRQVCTDDPDVVARWLADNDLAGAPLVLKPTKSAGTDSVYLVEPGDDWRPLFHRILGSVNRMGLVNRTVLVMEYAEGPEFMVDTYSADGKHGLVMVSVYGKHNRGHHLGIYDMGETLAPDDPRSTVLFDYTKLVADAIGIRNAAGHAEVILTPHGPRLVEMAARFSGSCMQIHQRLSTGDCQIWRTVRHRVEGEFVPHYEMAHKARTTWLSACRAGRLVDVGPLERALELPSVRAASLPRVGTWIDVTADVWGAIGWMILVSDDDAALEADYAAIRELERRLAIEP